ncbi:MAG: 2'-5' RNA ligase family protein [Victivallaceae bacterium]
MDNIFANPTYIVVNVPSPVAENIREIRRWFDPERADMSVEITLAGSGGLGTVLSGQSQETVFAEVDRIAAAIQPFSAKLSELSRFPDTGICYYIVRPAEPFVELQRMLAESAIVFNPCPFPFIPHCTLILHEDEQELKLRELRGLPIPDAGFMIDTISVYRLNEEMLEPVLLHRANFSMKSTGYA